MTFTTKDWKDYPDTSTPITAAALEDLETRTTGYADGRTGLTLVTSLPSSPSDGDVCHLQTTAMATDGLIWTFRYRSGSSSSYKWEFVGGSPLTKRFSGSYSTVTMTTGGTLYSIGTTGTIPIAGEYLLEAQAGLAPSTYAHLMYFGAGPYSSIDTRTFLWQPRDSTASNTTDNAMYHYQHVTNSHVQTCAANDTLRCYVGIASVNGETVRTEYTFVKATPIRV